MDQNTINALNTFLQIGIVGVGLSYVLQYLKAKFTLSQSATKGVTLALSVLLGGAYYLLKDTSIWVSIVGVLSASTIFWAFFLKGGSTEADQE